MSSSPLPADNVLARIIEHKWGEIATAKRLRPVEAIQEQLASAPPVRDFVASRRDSWPRHSPATGLGTARARFRRGPAGEG